MPDYGAKAADKAIAEAAKKIRKVYAQAAEELRQSFADFTRKHLERQKYMLAKVEKGEMTQAAYTIWMRGQVFIGAEWERKINQAAEIMQNANAEAAMIVREGKLHVFAENYNFSSYELEKGLNGTVSFQLYNDQAVNKLLTTKPQLLPEWRIDEPKDYIWNRQKVENVITQGIIQGKPVDKIMGDLVGNLCTANENKMRTFARTAITGAQNAGRQQQMEDAEELGIEVHKKWVATLDDRTRDLHQELDGQEVPVDEDFHVGDYTIAYPGDPTAAPEMVYNCRCTMIQVYPGISRERSRRAYYEDEHGYRKSEVVGDMTYKEWVAWKERRR